MKWEIGDLTAVTLKVSQHVKLHSVVERRYITEDGNFRVIECLTLLWIEFLSLAVVHLCAFCGKLCD